MASSTAYGGRILLDGTELREAAPESVYELISVIQQNVFVFNASIVENISMFRQFPQAELGDAIRHAHLGELLARRGTGQSLRGKRVQPLGRREAVRFHCTEPFEKVICSAGG